MRQLLRKGSVGRRVFVAIVAAEVAFAAVMGVTIGVFGLLSDVRQRQESIRQISSSLAAGLMPMIADQQLTHVEAQLASVLDTAEIHDVIGVCIRDSAGNEIACQSMFGVAVREQPENRAPWSVLTEEQVVVEPVIVDGLEVASIAVRFAPPGFSPLGAPMLASLIVLAIIMVVSIPWAAWRLMVDVVEPLDDLGRYAERLASDGEVDIPAPAGMSAEIAEFHQGLREMAQQLRDRDERLRDFYGELEEAYRELERRNAEIEQLSSVKSNFVAVAAHEIRGPLSTISLYAELLEAGELGELDPAAQEALGAISSAAWRLKSIVSDLMDSALLERGLLPITFGDVQVASLVEGAVRDAQPLARQHEVSIGLQGPIPDLSIKGDGGRLRQVLDNILSNAFKYSPPGGRVVVSVTADSDTVAVEVADWGRGVASEDQGVLFTLFGRVDVGDSRDTAGLGLGLAISARIVEAHGGRLTHRANENGVGSVFRIELPCGDEADRENTTIRVSGGETRRE